jgi:hypothetical protein
LYFLGLQEEVAAKLARLPPSLIRQARDTYTTDAKQAGFDCMMLELTVLSLLAHMGDPHGRPASPAYRQYLHDFGVADVSKIDKLLSDPFLLRKFQV